MKRKERESGNGDEGWRPDLSIFIARLDTDARNSVCPSVCLSVTFIYRIETAEEYRHNYFTTR